MRFRQLYKQMTEQLLESSIEEHEHYYGHNVVKTQDGVYVDFRPTHFQSINEAKQSIKQQQSVDVINNSLNEAVYREMPNTILANIIHKHNGDVKVTDTLIESYTNLAISKAYTTDNVVYDMRVMNRTNRLVEGYLDYILDDGTTIAITEREQKNINNLLEHHDDVVHFMKQNKENFLQVLEQLKD